MTNTSSLLLARKGQKVLRGVLIANAVLILIGLVRTIPIVAPRYLLFELRYNPSFVLSILGVATKLILSVPVYRGMRIPRALYLILTIFGLINFIPFLIRTWNQLTFSIFLQTASSLVVMGWLLHALLIDTRVKAYFAALAAGTDLQEKPLEEMIDEIGNEES